MRWLVCAAVLVMLGALGACDAHQLRESAGPSGRSGVSGAAGASDSVGAVQVREVRLLADPRGQPAGSPARVEFFLVNRDQHAEELLGARSPLAEDAQLRWDRGCTGRAEPVPSLPLEPQGTVPAAAGQPAGAIPYDMAVRLREPARPGTTFPVRFRFARAGEITVDAKVRPAEPPRAPCAAPPAPAAEHDADAAPTTTSGVVRTGRGPDCRVLDSGGGRSQVLLGGDPAVVRPGARVEISGRPATGTHPCGPGTALHVLTARPAPGP